MRSERPTQTQLLAQDLSAFADPAVEVVVTPSRSQGYSASWMQDGEPRTATFTFGDESAVPTEVRVDERSYSYRSFLAGAGMADLRVLARNTAHVISPVRPPYVGLRAQLLDEAAFEDDAESLIEQRAEFGHDKTNLVFISAGAGMGKTTVLRELVRRKASEYLRGEAEALWIYVDAQGRRLAQLDEALAAELDDLRARFPYHAAAALVRSGALVLVIDGFDELIGSVGSYDEAFSSLADFIASLHGSGCVVAAARSAYYEQEFLTRANSKLEAASDTWLLRGLRLLEWASETRRSYTRQYGELRGTRGDALDDMVTRVEAVLGSSEVAGVSSRPLFVSRTVEIMVDAALPDGISLLDRLVAAYILREVSEKLKAPNGAPMLTGEQYRDLLRELASEMWKQESRELTRASVREIGRLVGELLEIPEVYLDEVVERLPYAALLAQGSSSGAVSFEHDVFYSYFLAEPIRSLWLSQDGRALARMLRRGRLPEEAATLAAGGVGQIDAQILLDTLVTAVSSSDTDREQIRRNAGHLAAAILQDLQARDLRVRNLAFSDISFGACLLSGCLFEACSFSGTDLTRASFDQCTGDRVLFDRITLSSETRLDFDGVGVEDFYGLTVREGDSERLVFSPQALLVALARAGLPSADGGAGVKRAVDDGVVGLLERLCRLFLKTNSVTEDDDNEMVPIVRDRDWQRLRRVLLDSGVLSIQYKSASGRKMFLRRHARPQDIMAGADPRAAVPDPVRRLWDLLESECP